MAQLMNTVGDKGDDACTTSNLPRIAMFLLLAGTNMSENNQWRAAWAKRPRCKDLVEHGRCTTKTPRIWPFFYGGFPCCRAPLLAESGRSSPPALWRTWTTLAIITVVLEQAAKMDLGMDELDVSFYWATSPASSSEYHDQACDSCSPPCLGRNTKRFADVHGVCCGGAPTKTPEHTHSSPFGLAKSCIYKDRSPPAIA